MEVNFNKLFLGWFVAFGTVFISWFYSSATLLGDDVVMSVISAFIVSVLFASVFAFIHKWIREFKNKHNIAETPIRNAIASSSIINHTKLFLGRWRVIIFGLIAVYINLSWALDFVTATSREAVGWGFIIYSVPALIANSLFFFGVWKFIYRRVSVKYVNPEVPITTSTQSSKAKRIWNWYLILVIIYSSVFLVSLYVLRSEGIIHDSFIMYITLIDPLWRLSIVWGLFNIGVFAVVMNSNIEKKSLILCVPPSFHLMALIGFGGLASPFFHFVMLSYAVYLLARKKSSIE